ncbi:hypothetical protein [Stenotrophomonas phage A1432]|uniref:NAD(+)--protein-arginine ADP-ribosyltransferase n=1 Tax=Stenotrophomonas phage A1432 TaxID=2930315 RepID=A0A9E7N156_9CAUD|nr:hypothetical protein P9A45_gp73 [Stenotrophomonas phage A1432]UTC27957.1 hypothetical protein [Stenotrophomonas phage A1432]
MAKPANEEILDATVRHQIKLLRFSQGQANKAASLLAQSDDELVALLKTELTDTSAARINALLKEVRRMRAAVAQEIQGQIQGDMNELAPTEAEWESSMIQGATPMVLSFNQVPATVLKAVAGSPINGIPLEGWLGKMAANDVSRIEQQVRLGVLQGETIDQMVGRIRGTKAAGYKDGVLETTRREAEMIARTATNHVSTGARQATWDANADIIKGVRWVATLDGRTSPVCQSRDGEIYPLDKGPRPPAHPNCRSTVAPVLYGEEIVGDRPTITDSRTRRQREIDFRAEAKEAAGDKWKSMSVPERNAAIKARREAWADANIGQTPSSTNYQSWLKGQSKEFQDEVLGKGKAQLFRDGLPLEKFVDEKGKPYSLAELKAELEGDKLNVIQPGVGLKAKSLLQQGLTSDEVLAQIKQEFPDASTSAASIASYKSELNKAGALNLGPEGKVPTGALKQAQNVAEVVSNLDTNLPANLKQAIGGQWSTVVEDLDGSPGAYGYYQAGKGVMLSGKKLAAVPATQAKQIVSHELGHLLHKQHDLTLDPIVLDAVKASAKALSPDARKLYSYYLTSPDELIAELYAQALSPSPLTSQGLSAVEFNKAFAPAIQASKDAMAKKFPMPSAKAASPLPGGPVLPYEVAGKHTSVGSLAKALLQQGMPDEQVLKSVLAEFPDAKTKQASINSYKSELKKQGLLPNQAAGPVIAPKPIAGAVQAPVSAEAAVAAPAATAVTPATYQVSSSVLKEAGLDLMKQGMLTNQDLYQALVAQYPKNVSDIKLANIATWKTNWKKADPKAYAAAVEKAGKAEKVATKAGPTAQPKLLGQKLGQVSTNVLEKVKSAYAGGASSQQLLETVKDGFGALKQPGADDLIELAKYQVDTAKAAGKPYLNQAFKPTATPEAPATMKPARPAATPREGLPPPPRFDADQRSAGVKKYAGSVPTGQMAAINAEQKRLGLPELTREEVGAIRAYTGSTYRALNNALRAGKYSSDPFLQAYVEAAQHGMSKMPKFKGATARGLTLHNDQLKAMLSTYHKGAIVEDAAFVSSSYGNQAAFSGNVYMKIESKTGVNVSRYSQYDTEREVLYMPGTRFRVDNVEQVNGKYIISMSEV